VSKIDELWEQARANPGTRIDLGDVVSCDLCDIDWTSSTESGGAVFQSKVLCPRCAPRFLRRVVLAREERFIRARCPPGQSFSDFIREYRRRSGSNSICIGPVVQP